MNKKETWEDIQKNDKRLAELLIELKNTFGRVKLIRYNKNESLTQPLGLHKCAGRFFIK